jgi:hypothetical protein
MNEVTRLSGTAPVSPTQNRVWKPPRRQKTGERPPERKKRHPRKNEDEQRDAALRSGDRGEPGTGEEERRDENGEAVSYGSDGLKKRQSHKVDVVI